MSHIPDMNIIPCYMNGKYSNIDVRTMMCNSKFLYYTIIRLYHPTTKVNKEGKEILKDVTRDTVLTVGKYKGKKILDVINIKAFLVFYRENKRRFTDKIREFIEANMNHNIILYGKYKGKELEEGPMKEWIKKRLSNKKFNMKFKKYNPVLYNML